MRSIHFTRQFNWRMLLVRIFVNALALLVISILPYIYFVEPTFLRVMFVALVLGVLNAIVKPIIQFLTLRFIFITYGFALVLINTLILLLLAVIMSSYFVIERLVWAIIAGALLGLVSAFFENLLGLQVPIIPYSTGLLPEPGEDPGSLLEARILGSVIGQSEQLEAEDTMEIEATGSEDEAIAVNGGEEE